MLLLQLLLNGFAMGCAFAMVALGFALIYNTTRIFHIAHGALYVMAAYLLFAMHMRMGWPLWVGIPVTLGLVALAGVACDWALYRPLDKKGASLLIHLLTSLGAYTIVVNLIAMVFGSQTQVFRTAARPTYSIGGLILNQIQLISIITLVVLCVACWFILRGTQLGLRLRAMRDNPTLISLSGINPWAVRSMAFALGSGICGLGAILLALDLGIDPHIGMAAVLVAAVAVIVGGIGTFEGPIIGGVLVGLLQSVAVWQASARWQEMVTFIVLILFLVFRPQGILGQKKRLEEAPV